MRSIASVPMLRSSEFYHLKSSTRQQLFRAKLAEICGRARTIAYLFRKSHQNFIVGFRDHASLGSFDGGDDSVDA